MKIKDMSVGQRFMYKNQVYIVTSHNKDIGFGLQVYCCNLGNGRLILFGGEYCIDGKDVL